MTSTAKVGRFTDEASAAFHEVEFQLLGFGGRLSYLLSAQKAFDKTTRGRAFTIKHWPMWRMVVGESDMFINDLSSWVKGFSGKGGFLRRLRGPNDLKALVAAWPHHLPETERRLRKEASLRLFPDAKGGAPNHLHMEALHTELRKRFKPLLDDRNQYRAHKFERNKPKKAKMLSLSEVPPFFDEAKKLVRDVRYLASHSTFGSYDWDVRVNGNLPAALDVVDLVLCGPIPKVIAGVWSEFPDLRFYGQRRTAYYERRHQAFEASSASVDEDPFNE